ncbi:MAG: carboxymuconolactone decarboxylase family protein [Acidimicrobiales bacterium]
MVARVELVQADQAPLLVRHLFDAGDPGVIARALAIVPEVAEVAMPFLAVALGPGSVPPDVKETVILRTSAVLGCRYCVDAHTVVAMDMGLGAEGVRALREAAVGTRPPGADDDTAALVAWIDSVAGGRGPVPDAVHAALSARFADHQVVELVVTLGATMLLNRLCTALALPSSPETLARLATDGFARE